MKGNDDDTESADGRAWRAHAKRRDLPTMYRRSGGLAVIVTAAAIGLAACGGSSSPTVASLPTVASPGKSSGGGGSSTTNGSGGSTATKLAKGDPTRLVDEWATCMHSHGDPNQADPIIDAYGVINVTIPGDGADAVSLSSAVHGGTDPCNKYMAAAESALRAANPVAPPPNQSEQLKYVSCMRANGVPKYPYPVGNQTNFNGTGVDPNSPLFMNANKVCGKQIGAPAWWISGTGPPGDVTVGNVGPNGGPPPSSPAPNRPRPATGGNGGAGANTPVPAAGG